MSLKTKISSTKTPNKLLSEPKIAIPDDYKIIKKLSETKNDVYLIYSPKQHKQYVMKVFEFEDGQPSDFYLNEKRFSFLQHISLYQPLFCVDRKVWDLSGDQKFESSIIFSDFATHGSLYDLIFEKQIMLPEKVIRTYFHQIIDGVEYLHKNNVIHLDLKLDNIMIGFDYNIRIIDFD
mmetsp:Transcript_39955/g.35664  ORF Transcript_39955/g.35664 Transcript_39955/m.35664 type:complete len:178 (-) Transcript_39955:1206-1739(-)